MLPLEQGHDGLQLAGGGTEGPARASQLKGICPHLQEQSLNKVLKYLAGMGQDPGNSSPEVGITIGDDGSN